MQAKNPLKWDIQQNHEHLVVQLIGCLNRDTLLPLWKQRASFLSVQPNQQIYWDLKQLESIDSAGFALLAEILNHYHKTNPCSLLNPPDTIVKLAELFDLSGWLNTFLILPNGNR